MSRKFHETTALSSPWKHHGTSQITLMAGDPAIADDGRVALVVESGAATVHLRPTMSEVVLLTAMLQGFLEQRGLVEVPACST